VVHRYFAAGPDTAVIADTLTAMSGKTSLPEFFDLFTNNLSTVNGATVLDGAPTRFTAPLFAFPTAPVVTPGTDACPKPARVPGNCIIKRKDGGQRITPGHYGVISVLNAGQLTFAPGSYDVDSIRGGPRSEFLFEGTTTLNVANTMRVGYRSYFGPAFGTDPNGRCIVVNVAGDKVLIRPAASMTATITAPDAEMMMAASGVYIGNFTARVVKMRKSVLLQAAPHTPACQ